MGSPLSKKSYIYLFNLLIWRGRVLAAALGILHLLYGTQELSVAALGI